MASQSVDNVKNMMRNNPRARSSVFATAFVIVVVLVVSVMLMFSSHKKASQAAADNSTVSEVPQVKSVAGTSQSGVYNDLVGRSNQTGYQQAVKANASDVPTLRGPGSGSLSDAMGDNPPSPRLPKDPTVIPVVQPPQPDTVVPVAQPPTRASVTNTDESSRNASANAQKQMDMYLSAWKLTPGVNEFPYYGKRQQAAAGSGPGATAAGQSEGSAIASAASGVRTAQSVYGSYGAPASGSGQAGLGQPGLGQPGSGQSESGQSGSKASAESGSAAQKGPLFVRAGTVIPAMLITPVNSDTPGPVLAEITSGPLAGTRVLGTFQASLNQVVLSFSTISGPLFQHSFQIQAFAVDADTSSPGLATDVNHHYLAKYGMLAAAAFVSGYGQAIANQGSSTIIGPFGATVTQSPLSTKQVAESAFGNVGSAIGQQVQQESSQIKPTIKVSGADGRGGIPIGLLFMSDF